MRAFPPTLDYQSAPAPAAEGWIAERSPYGVTLRLPQEPLWQEVLKTAGALLVSAAAVAVIGVQTWEAAARGASPVQWGGRVVVGVWCAMLALASLHSSRRLRRRLRGEPVAETVYLPAADQPGDRVLDVWVVGGPNRYRPRLARLRIDFATREPLEFDADGSVDDLSRRVTELRLALRLPVPEAPPPPYTH
jgi:hypothetical protein